MKVRDLKKFLEATDPNVEVMIQVPGGTTELIVPAVSVEDVEVGAIVLKGYPNGSL